VPRKSLGTRGKKLANLGAAVAIHVAYFNFCWRPRENKGGKLRPTPAMMANLTPLNAIGENAVSALPKGTIKKPSE
jgi:hypothetical protein